MPFGPENVAVFRVAKFDLAKSLQPGSSAGADNFLGFDFVEFADEDDHVELPHRPVLRYPSGKRARPNLVRTAKALAANGFSSAKIAKRLGVAKATANRYVRS